MKRLIHWMNGTRRTDVRPSGFVGRGQPILEGNNWFAQVKRVRPNPEVGFDVLEVRVIQNTPEVVICIFDRAHTAVLRLNMHIQRKFARGRTKFRPQA